ncbi:TraR/DksA C4-type zinc finger protein [Fictibacillus iocasae]|uniref:TraR/DksA C4-type zinc finger protein n=1 Tax=Fictibacillus iocasae TaxID=2715437 RepID=A0ABW2NUY3_9BACL
MALSQKDIKTFKSLLVEQKKEIEDLHEMNDQFRPDDEFKQEETGELSHYDNHPADLGTELYDKERNMVLSELQEKELSDIDQALKRIESGNYGLCAECGADIPKERLEALPATPYCLDHANHDHGKERERPVEEEVLKPGYGQFNNDKKEKNFFDGEDTWESLSRYGSSETPSDDPKKADYRDRDDDPMDEEGYTEEIEGFAAADMNGNKTGVLPNKKHDEYENKLDAEEEKLADQRKYE